MIPFVSIMYFSGSSYIVCQWIVSTEHLHRKPCFFSPQMHIVVPAVFSTKRRLLRFPTFLPKTITKAHFIV